ncbi:MAG: MoxR family ATPase [Lachnospiraceae bacterium]|nr:MoxR family ATPase [Lachnospiraceae bacterium]
MDTIEKIRENIGKVIIGKKEVIDCMLTAIIARGHILLEDVPGTGKTMLAKSLAKSMDGTFARVQFTPDLLPADITGVSYYHQSSGEFVFRKGPVFFNILLADEINRATPRTQAGLLEAMEERQVSVDGITYPLEEPFLVMATQNPLETLGTFPLPEAQLDRFLMKLSMGLPNKEEEIAMMERFMEAEPLQELKAVAGREEIVQLQKQCRQVYVHPILLNYIADLSKASRERNQVENGISPRGTLALLNACRGYALVAGRDYVVPEDIKAVAVPVLAHRIQLSGAELDRDGNENFIKGLLDSVVLPTEDWKRR